MSGGGPRVSDTRGRVNPGQRVKATGGLTPASQTRRRASETRLQRPNGPRRPSPRSWCSRASTSALRFTGDGLNLQRRPLGRRPEFGRERDRAARHGGQGRRGGSTAGLTANPTASSASSGKAWGSRSDDGDLVGRSLKTTAMAMKRSSPGLLCSVRRERGSRRSWEACRGGAAVAEATVAMDGGDGDSRVREREKGKSMGERRVRPGDRGGTEKKRRGVALAG